MRIAVIDLGTNTFNLLIAEINSSDKNQPHFTVLHNSKEGVSLGMGGINENRISELAIQRAMNCFEKFSAICVEFKTNNIRAIGTSAVRDAKNSVELTDKVKSRFGITIEIINGQQEAELIYKGVSWTYDFQSPSLIMDIGGGSTEFIRGYKDEKIQSCSLNIGVSRAIQLFDLQDPMTSDNQHQLLDWFSENADPLSEFDAATTLVGASGCFETFYEMIHKTTFPQGLEIIPLDLQQLNETLDWIIQSTFQEREDHPSIIPIRRHMAPIAALKTKWIIEKFAIQNVILSPCSLKEGVLKDEVHLSY